MEPNHLPPLNYYPGWIKPWGKKIRDIEAGYPNLKIVRPILLVGAVILIFMVLWLAWVMILGTIFDTPLDRSEMALMNGGTLVLVMLAIIASIILCILSARKHRACQEVAAETLTKSLIESSEARDLTTIVLAVYIILDSITSYGSISRLAPSIALTRIKKKYPIFLRIIASIIGKDQQESLALLATILVDRSVPDDKPEQKPEQKSEQKTKPVRGYFEECGAAGEFPPSHDGACSDDACPCPGNAIPWGEGYLYISRNVVKQRRKARSIAEYVALAQKIKSDWARQKGLPVGYGAKVIFQHGFQDVLDPILLCEQGARLRQLDLDVAAADARHWWKTGLVPLRPTPRK